MIDLTALPPLVVPRSDAPPGLGGGRLKHVPADFVVEELPAYPASGEGDFFYLTVECEDVSGPMLAREVARRLRVGPGDVGMAGMKDRRAITRQRLSVPARGVTPEAVEGPVGATGRIRLLAVERHNNKLRTGHLAGNRFAVRLRGRDPADDAALGLALEDLAARGFANTFGPQRFSDGQTVAAGLDAMAGRRIHDRRLLRLGVSAVQAALFNHWLSRRVADGLLDRVLAGDVLQKRSPDGRLGGVFVSREAAVDGERLAQGELVVTGPVFGTKMRRAEDEAGTREAAVLDEAGLTTASFEPVKKVAEGTRRPAVVWPGELTWARDDEGVVVRFTLPPGSYATVLLALACGPLDAGPE